MLEAVEHGNGEAADQLLPLVYAELRRLAAHKMAQENPGQTLQPTALVHEAWLKLVGQENRRWKDRNQFFAAAAEAMRRILTDNARRKLRQRRGGGRQRVELDDDAVATEADDQVLAVDEALEEIRPTRSGARRGGEAALFCRPHVFRSRRRAGHFRTHGQAVLGLCPRLAAGGNPPQPLNLKAADEPPRNTRNTRKKFRARCVRIRVSDG